MCIRDRILTIQCLAVTGGGSISEHTVIQLYLVVWFYVFMLSFVGLHMSQKSSVFNSKQLNSAQIATFIAVLYSPRSPVA